LAFVRDRKGLPGGDLDRIKDQQYFLSQLLHKVLSAGTLADPARLTGFLSAVVADVTVDQGFGLSQMTTLGSRLRHLDPAHVTFATLPVLSSSAVRLVHGLRVDVVLLDPARTAQLFAGLHDGTGHPAPGTGAAAGQPLTVAPAAIALEVRNGTSTAGLAGRVARSLRRHGGPDRRALPTRHARRGPHGGRRPAGRPTAGRPHPDRRGPARPGPGLTGSDRGAPGQLSHTERARWPTGRRHQPTAAVGLARCCLRTLIKTTRGDQGTTGLLCRSAGLPPGQAVARDAPDRPCTGSSPEKGGSHQTRHAGGAATGR